MINQAFTGGLMQGYGFVDAARRNKNEDEFRQTQRARLIEEQKRADEERVFRKAMMESGMKAMTEGYGEKLPMAPQSTGEAPGESSAKFDVGLQPVATPRRDARTEEERAFDMSRAMIDHAMKSGRADIAAQLYFGNADVRNKVREQAINRGWAALKATGDPNVLAQVANRYIMDGVTINEAQAVEGPNGKAIKITGIGPNGNPFDETLSPEDFEKRMGLYLDPDRARAAEIQRLQAAAELQNEITKARATKPKDFVDSYKPGERVIGFTETGPRVIQEPGLEPQVVKRNQGEGMGDEVMIVGGTGGAQTVVAGGQSAPSGALNSGEQKILGAAINTVNENFNRQLSSISDDATREKVSKQAAQAQQIVPSLILANRGRQQVNEGTLASVAYGLATGQIKPEKVRWKETGDVIDAVVLPDGSMVAINPQQMMRIESQMSQRKEALKLTPPGAPKDEPSVRGRGMPGLEPVPPMPPPGAKNPEGVSKAQDLKFQIANAKAAVAEAKSKADSMLGVEKQRQMQYARELESQTIPMLERELKKITG